MLFSELAIWTMIHGIALGGAALMALSAALFSMGIMSAGDRQDPPASRRYRSITGLTVFIAAVLWLTVLIGTYIIFPPYRATPPAGAIDLAGYPRALIHNRPETVWLHAFAMEGKEHMPWIASMLATAVAFVGVRYRSRLLTDAHLRGMAMTLLAVCFVLVAFAGVMGIFVNKAAPLR